MSKNPAIQISEDPSYKEMMKLSQEECFKRSRLHLAESAKSYFLSCLFLKAGHSKIKNSKGDWYAEQGLTKERAAEMLRVAETFKDFKSAQIRTYGDSALRVLADLGNVGKAIVRSGEQFKVEDLKTIRKNINNDVKQLDDDEEILEAVYTVVRQQPPPSARKKSTQQVSEDFEPLEIIQDSSKELQKVRRYLEKPRKPNDSYKLSIGVKGIVKKHLDDAKSAIDFIISAFDLTEKKGDKK